jgi:putative Holliday junction resolvase
MKALALDVGDRRVGVALSDETGLIAAPLSVIRRASKVEDYTRIAKLVREHGIDTLVVGHPLNDDGSAGPQAWRIERYADALGEALRSRGLNLALVLWDEWGSTQKAQEIMLGAGRRSRDRRARVDAVAAAVILQDYLDSQRSSTEEPGE